MHRTLMLAAVLFGGLFVIGSVFSLAAFLGLSGLAGQAATAAELAVFVLVVDRYILHKKS
ncbi:MAG: hypothetical protein KGI38_11805 [Thaumarchaeota archaeon]|nr:hypothetical protein [Nitrososphaerota archaeon]